MGRRKGDKASEYKPATWDKVSPPQTYFDELFRVSKNQVIWGANHFIKKMPYNSPCWLMWDKKFSEDVTFAQFELAWTSFNTTTKKFEMFPNNEKRIHPTQKPVELYRWILRRYAKAGDLILDTHVGSGSSLVACIEAGYDFYGTEIDEDYYRAAQERISRATRVYELFEGAY